MIDWIKNTAFRLHKWMLNRPDCYIWFNEWDHDWHWTPDEPDVGIYSCRECRVCGHVDEEAVYSAPLFEDDIY